MTNSKLFIFSVVFFICLLRLVSAVDVLEVTDISPTSLVPGEYSELNFRLENTGDENLEDVVFSWEEKTGNILPIGLSNKKTIEELDNRDDQKIKFDIFVSASAEPGLYELIFTTTYKHDNETIAEISKAGIIVGGQTDFDVSVSDISSSGIILSVANIGKNPANSVNIAIPLQSNFKISGSTSSIIGNLDKGDYSVASFQVVPQSAGSSNLNVEIQYTDTLGARQNITKSVTIQSTQQSFSSGDLTGSPSDINDFATQGSNSGNNNLFLIAFVVTGILTIILIFMIIRKSKRENETD